MGWLYIVIRTYPFWSLPIGISLISGYMQGKKDPKRRQNSILMMFSGIALIISAVAFLFFQGHFKAVPLTHEIFTSDFVIPEHDAPKGK
jgi:hypothetical protein